MSSIVNTLKLKCFVSREYLRSHLSSGNLNNNSYSNSGRRRCGFELVSEYILAWNGYVCLLLELEEQQMSNIMEIFSECLEYIAPEYPHHPRVSMFRLMTKIWIHYVWECDELRENLFGCFLKILSHRRTDNFAFQMGQISLDTVI